ncbi:T9SS type A sorting domain-containing protein [Flavobacterium selenitireducens]|uniref:T9SS type A sorting domain-containing protein n=1 Tax=Flavobacterium selenitireducens TaxID=2722704 RepID=UPI00168BE038|nr:T9SS type A sorting domain-containing protein [Flavobacterium selenitireducens]MBD3582704.1 T9SS type A sorting domain-containing protein [Flavobacterium selenitireducens]
MKTKLFSFGRRCSDSFGKSALLLIMTVGGLFLGQTASGQITNVGSSNATTTGTSLAIPKPAGLAVGDMMFLSIVQSDNDANGLADPTPSGWTEIAGNQIGSSGTSLWRGTLLYRFANAADVSAASFSVTLSSGTNGDGAQGAITVFRGVDADDPFDATGDALSANTSAAVLSAGSKTASDLNSAAVLFAFTGQAASTHANWSTTSPGALTELYDLPFAAAPSQNSLGAAWAIKSGTGGTGIASVGITPNGRGDAVLVLLKQDLSLGANAISGSPFCQGEVISVPLAIKGTFAANNTFTVQLSNASGSFTSATTIATLTNATTATAINATIPNGQAAGTGYRIRVNSSNPAITGDNNGSNLSIVAKPTANAGTAVSACSTGAPANITAGATAANNAGITWTSNGLGTILNANSLTGATYSADPSDGPTVTLTLTATGNGSCANVISNKTLTIVNPPTAAAGGSATICENQTVQVSGASSSNGTILWTENGAGTITAGANTLTPTYTAAAGDAGNTVTLTMTVSNGGCTPATATFTVNVTGLPIAVAGTPVAVCADAVDIAIGTGASASNNSGVEWSSNGTGSFANATSLNSATYTPSPADVAAGSVTLTLTAFGNSPCGNTTSTKTLTLHALPTPVVITPSSQSICPGTTVALNGAGGVLEPNAFYSDNFNGTLSFATAGTASNGTAFTVRTSPHFAGVNSFASPDNSKFVMSNLATLVSNGSANTQLTSATFSSVGFESLSLSYKHSYRKGSEGGVNVQISTNGGTSWTNIRNHNSNQGASDGLVTDNVDLSAYINQSNLKIRFNYVANVGWFGTAWWAIDDVVVSGIAPKMVWSPTTGLYTDAAATIAYTGTITPNVYAKPSATTTYTATSASSFGCGSESAQITLTVNQATLSGVAQSAAVCQDTAATFTLTGLVPNSVSNITYHIGAGGNQTAGSVIADGSGSASFTTNVALANNGQTLTVTNIEWTNATPVCNFAPTSGNTVAVQVNANVTYYADADGDGFGNLAVTQVSCFGAPAGFVADNTDCNDADNTKHTTFAFYVDVDLDGFGTGSLVTVCAVDANTPPAGYSLNNTDCNDANAAIHEEFDFFVDADGDGFGSTTIASVCAVDASTPPTGYSLDSSDCNDANPAIHAEFQFYFDGDADGYGVGSLVSVCAVDANTPPLNYALVNGDCNDNAGAVNPGHVEVLYNGIDDNCDGNLDEGNQLVSQVLASQCGATLTTMSSVIGCVSFPTSITGYRFKVINTQTLSEQTINRTAPHFQLTQLASYDYATTYSVSIELQRNGVWLGYYGPSCLVSSPAVLDSNGAAQVTESQCGITLPSISTLIATTSLPGATGYRFKVTNLDNPLSANAVQTIDRNYHWFSLTMLTEFTYGTTYMIEVSVKTNGVFSGFGSPCEVSSPEVPTIVNCGAVIASKATLISTASLNRVTSYRFEITDMTTLQVYSVDRNKQWFSFSQISPVTPGGQMAIRVAMMTSGVWSDFSEACFVTAPGAARSAVKEDDTAPEIAYRVVSYPNPYIETFALDADLPTEEAVNVKIYDMLGKLVDTRTFEAVETESQQFGSNLSAGVYNIVVSQGANVKTLRIIKR